MNSLFLEKTAKTKMPYGKYKGRYLIDIPDHYIVWMAEQGFPETELGRMLATVYEVRLNGLEELLRNIRNKH